MTKYALLACSLLLPQPVHTQSGLNVSTGAEAKTFDVITIKRSNSSEDGLGLGRATPDMFEVVHSPLRTLIARSYGVKLDAVEGPSWLDSDQFDIQAKVLPDAAGNTIRLNRAEIDARVRSLLADRFQMKAHFETRKIPIYELYAPAGATKLKSAIPGNTYADGIKGPGGESGAGLSIVLNNRLVGQAVSMETLLDVLSDLLRTTVIDKTNLPGKYDITLSLPYQQHFARASFGANERPDAKGEDKEEPSLNERLIDQLGLKLVGTKGDGRVLVIDSISPPTPN